MSLGDSASDDHVPGRGWGGGEACGDPINARAARELKFHAARCHSENDMIFPKPESGALNIVRTGGGRVIGRILRRRPRPALKRTVAPVAWPRRVVPPAARRSPSLRILFASETPRTIRDAASLCLPRRCGMFARSRDVREYFWRSSPEPMKSATFAKCPCVRLARTGVDWQKNSLGEYWASCSPGRPVTFQLNSEGPPTWCERG
jgi:hypothetical protein